jgi:hypothetical protein
MNNVVFGSMTKTARETTGILAVVLGLSGVAFSQHQNRTDRSQGGLFDHETTQEQDKTLYEQSELKRGDLAPKIKLTPLTDSGLGSAVQLSSLYKEKPLVVLMGSCTCGLTKDNLPQLKKAYKKYGDKAHFAFIYMKDAHPSPKESVEVDGKKVRLEQPKTMSHRIDLAKYLIQETGLTLPVYVDDMKGTARKAYSGFHLSAYVINTDGKLVFAERYKYKAADVEAALIPLLKTN